MFLPSRALACLLQCEAGISARRKGRHSIARLPRIVPLCSSEALTASHQQPGPKACCLSPTDQVCPGTMDSPGIALHCIAEGLITFRTLAQPTCHANFGACSRFLRDSRSCCAWHAGACWLLNVSQVASQSCRGQLRPVETICQQYTMAMASYCTCPDAVQGCLGLTVRGAMQARSSWNLTMHGGLNTGRPAIVG